MLFLRWVLLYWMDEREVRIVVQYNPVLRHLRVTPLACFYYLAVKVKIGRLVQNVLCDFLVNAGAGHCLSLSLPCLSSSLLHQQALHFSPWKPLSVQQQI